MPACGYRVPAPGNHAKIRSASSNSLTNTSVWNSVFDPPFLFTCDVPARRRRESNATWIQRDRSSLRMSSAATRRPAATSASDSRRASWRTARSPSSSQSPGSSGKSCSSVPSGRSVGSSTTSRPSNTCFDGHENEGSTGRAAQALAAVGALVRSRSAAAEIWRYADTGQGR